MNASEKRTDLPGDSGVARPVSCGRFSVFAHLTAEKTSLYRAVLEVLVAERACFALAMRPAEIYAALAAENPAAAALAEVEAALRQLREWGNVDDTEDNSDVATIDAFYHRHRIYQLSAGGEAAEHALAVFAEHLGRPGELQTTALHDILGLLDSLPPLLAEDPLDDGKLHHALSSLAARFEQLATRAQSFMRSLQTPIDLQGLPIADFLAYKERLVDYLEHFIGELVVATNRIGEGLLQLEQVGIEQAFVAAARRDIVDALDRGPEALAAAEAGWRGRWRGLRRWFIGEGGPSHAEMLRARARAAIPALLTTVTQINDRRASRADRAADFHALARWFAEAPDDWAAHRLWRTAFALAPARHLRLNAETLARRQSADESPRTSWLEASPMLLTARLRQTGRHAAPGAAPVTIDRSAAKARLAELAREQATQLERARGRLLLGGRRSLTQIGPLDAAEFGLFLDLLGAALCQSRGDGLAVEASSADGALRIRLEPVADGEWVTLPTSEGAFFGRDHWIEIEPALAPAMR